MIQATLQTHMSTVKSLAHNNRTMPVPHADKIYGTEHNYYWSGNESEKEFFEHEFEADWRAKQNRQTRKDRKHEETYYEYLTNKAIETKQKQQEMRTAGTTNYKIKAKNKNVKQTSYEMVVGIGNIHDNSYFGMDGEKQGVSVEILKQYIDTFNERNYKDGQGVKLYNASIHTDEAGVAHAHLDMVFISKNRHGEKEVSQTGALKSLGFETDKEKGPDGKRHNAIEKWRNSEREHLQKLCKQRDIEIIKGDGGRHLEKEEYVRILQKEKKKVQQERKKIEEVKAQQASAAETIDKQKAQINNFMSNTTEGQRYSEHCENVGYKKRDNRMRAEINTLWKEYQAKSAEYWDFYKGARNDIYDSIKQAQKGIWQANTDLNRQLYALTHRGGGLLQTLFRMVVIFALYLNKKSLETQLNELKYRNEELERMRQEISKKQQTTKNALKVEDVQKIKSAMSDWEAGVRGFEKELEQIVKEPAAILKQEGVKMEETDIAKKSTRPNRLNDMER